MWIALALLGASLLSAAPRANAPIWSKKGVSFRVACVDSFEDCKTLVIQAPNRRNSVIVWYSSTVDDPNIATATLRVVTDGKEIGAVGPVGMVDSELTWAPDSKAFFVNGNSNGYDDYHVAVHVLSEPYLGPGSFTSEVEEDMVRTFPPCKAAYAPQDCAEIASDPSFIPSAAVGWSGDSSAIAVMAQVPCTSYMGGIMCQVMGYEVSVPGGTIVRRTEAREFARRWQPSMAWKFNIPDPPEYASAK
jgi:hypothetical protein